jgi:hypothetical protein
MSASDNHFFYDTSGNYFDVSGNYHSAHDSHDEHDASHNVIPTYDASHNVTMMYDVSSSITNVRDSSGSTIKVVTFCEDETTIPIPTPIVFDLSSVVITGDGYQITDQTGRAADGSAIIRKLFTSTDPSNNDPNIGENLSQIVNTYNDELNNSPSSILLQQISHYASEITCSDFHGKGSIEDYTALFQAAASIANESKQMELDVDIEGFSEFGQAADELANLFESFITKLQNVNIITDITFLTSISTALSKIVHLSKIFGKFKETIFSTTTIQVPKSVRDSKVILHNVMDEVNCAMQYINHFVSPTDALPDADLSSTEKNIIAQAVHSIETWNVLCEQGVNIAMANDPDVQYIKNASSQLKTTTQNLKSITNTLKSKFVSINIHC